MKMSLPGSKLLPRYSSKAFPPYRYVPGMHPHPVRDPDGHSYGKKQELQSPFSSNSWSTCEDYLYGIDLFNHGYWWEAHESLEQVWAAAGRHTRVGLFIQGLIQIAAAHLKASQGLDEVAQRMATTGLEKMTEQNETYLGIDVAAFRADVIACFAGGAGKPVSIRLDLDLQ
jgi:hypothetical protein